MTVEIVEMVLTLSLGLACHCCRLIPQKPRAMEPGVARNKLEARSQKRGFMSVSTIVDSNGQELVGSQAVLSLSGAISHEINIAMRRGDPSSDGSLGR